MKRTIVVAITGASGATYSLRLVEVLLAAGCTVHLTISDAAQKVLEQELDLKVDLDHFNPAMLMLQNSEGLGDLKLLLMRSASGISGDSSNVLGVGSGPSGQLHYHHFRDLTAPVASGSFPTDGMVVCPCSGNTLSAIAHGVGDNLIHRAADVHLKERRTLVVVPRETPLSLPQIQNMETAARAGVVILPASPGFYHGVKLIGDLVDFIVSRICDQLGIANSLIHRWGESGMGSGIQDPGSDIAG